MNDEPSNQSIKRDNLQVRLAVASIYAKEGFVLWVITTQDGNRNFAILSHMSYSVVIYGIRAVAKQLRMAKTIHHSQNALAAVVALVLSVITRLVLAITFQASESLRTIAKIPVGTDCVGVKVKWLTIAVSWVSRE